MKIQRREKKRDRGGKKEEKGGKEEGESKGSDLAGDWEIFIKIKKKRQKVA